MNNSCNCGTSCEFIGFAVALVTGVIAGLLFYFDVFSSVQMALAVILVIGAASFTLISTAFLFARDCRLKKCLCRYRGALIGGALGTFFASFVSIVTAVAAFNVVSAVFVGLTAFFLILLITGLICLTDCAGECDG